MDINFSITQTAGTFSGKVLFVLYEASAPNTIIDHIERDPSVDDMNLTFYDKRWVAHIVKTFDSPGWPTLGTYKMGWIYQAQANKDETKDTIFLTMNGDEGDTYTDDSWVGWDIDFIQRRGFGMLKPGNDVEYLPNGFQILDSPFQEGENFDVHFKSRLTQADPINPPGGGGIFSKSKVLYTDYTIDAGTDQNTMFSCAGPTKQTVTLPALADVSENTAFGFSCFTDNLVIVSQTGDYMPLPRYTQKALLVRYEQLIVMKVTYTIAAQWLVVTQSPTSILTGMIIDHYTANDYGFVWANGTMVNRDTYQRLYEWVTMQPDILVDKSVWDANPDQQYKYHRGDGSTTFGLPLIKSIAKGIDGSVRKAGSYEDDAMKDHDHFVANTDTGEGSIDGNTSMKYSKDNGQRNAYILSGSATTPTIGKTSGVIGSTSSENLVKNFGVYKKIMI